MNDAPPVRVVLLSSPGTYGAIIINTLAAWPGIELAGIGLTNRVYRGKGLVGTVQTSVKRTGWKYTLYNALVANVAWTQLRLSGRPRGLKRCGNVRLIDDVNSTETVDWLKEAKPDFVASFYFNQWIGAGVREVSRRDCVNVHPSLLPALRGPDPAFRTLQRKLDEGGLTIHRVADEFDAGEIVAQRKLAVPAGRSVFGLYCDWAAAGAQFLGEWLAAQRQDAQSGAAGMPGGEASRDEPLTAAAVANAPQRDAEDYTTFPTAQEVGEFVRSGGRLVGWTELRQRVREIK